MKITGHVSREYKGKKYEKCWIVIPNKILEKLGWKRGDDIEYEIKNDKLILEKE